MFIARSGRLAAVVIAGLIASSAPMPAQAQSAPEAAGATPLMLQSIGSFFVGGHDRTTDAVSSNAPGNGTITIDQMYVQYQIPVPPKSGPQVPVVLLHGCCLSAKSFEETPDGRMGWNEYFVRRGYPTYLPEQVTRARSGFDPTVLNEIALGLDGMTVKDMPYLFQISHEGAYTSFRFGPSVGTPWPDEQFPVKYVNEFYKQLIPDLNAYLPSKIYPPTPNPTYGNLSRLARKLGGAVIVGHSESGFFPENAALVSTQDIKGIVSIEPGGSCTTTNPASKPLTQAQIDILATIPTLVLFGDHVEGSGFEGAYKNCQHYQSLIKAAGGDIVFIHLPELGIRGNSHMMMLDKNNLQVADIIMFWISEHVKG